MSKLTSIKDGATMYKLLSSSAFENVIADELVKQEPFTNQLVDSFRDIVDNAMTASSTSTNLIAAGKGLRVLLLFAKVVKYKTLRLVAIKAGYRTQLGTILNFLKSYPDFTKRLLPLTDDALALVMKRLVKAKLKGDYVKYGIVFSKEIPVEQFLDDLIEFGLIKSKGNSKALATSAIKNTKAIKQVIKKMSKSPGKSILKSNRFLGLLVNMVSVSDAAMGNDDANAFLGTFKSAVRATKKSRDIKVKYKNMNRTAEDVRLVCANAALLIRFRYLAEDQLQYVYDAVSKLLFESDDEFISFFKMDPETSDAFTKQMFALYDGYRAIGDGVGYLSRYIKHSTQANVNLSIPTFHKPILTNGFMPLNDQMRRDFADAFLDILRNSVVTRENDAQFRDSLEFIANISGTISKLGKLSEQNWFDEVMKDYEVLSNSIFWTVSFLTGVSFFAAGKAVQSTAALVSVVLIDVVASVIPEIEDEFLPVVLGLDELRTI